MLGVFFFFSVMAQKDVLNQALSATESALQTLRVDPTNGPGASAAASHSVRSNEGRKSERHENQEPPIKRSHTPTIQQDPNRKHFRSNFEIPGMSPKGRVPSLMEMPVKPERDNMPAYHTGITPEQRRGLLQHPGGPHGPPHPGGPHGPHHPGGPHGPPHPGGPHNGPSHPGGPHSGPHGPPNDSHL